MRYINIHRLTELPDLTDLAPFKSVVTVDDLVDDQRRQEISLWLVKMGCRYVMACGEQCEDWCTSVRRANLECFDLANMGADDFVMTTGHRYDSLKSVFWYAKKVAKHPEHLIKNCVVVHVANGDRSVEYIAMYQKA